MTYLATPEQKNPPPKKDALIVVMLIEFYLGILQLQTTYAIMPVGNKGYSCSIVSDNKKPGGVQDLRVFLFLFWSGKA